jgi:cysteine desulfurase / selenocysteine lyase
MPPFLGGGEMISNVTLEGATYNEVPYKFEAGTPVIAEAVGPRRRGGLPRAIGMDAVRDAREAIVEACHAGPGGRRGRDRARSRDPDAAGAAISFRDRGSAPHDIGTIMDRRASRCARAPLRQAAGARARLAATTRASFYLYNTVEEIDELVAAIDATKRFFEA